jgi:hypothetical protein
VYAINLKNKLYYLVLDGMPMVNAIFFKGGFWDQNMCCDAKCLCKTLVMKNMWIF